MKNYDKDKSLALIITANNIGDEKYGELDFGRLDIDAVKRIYTKLFTTYCKRVIINL
jgi:hypothetical protein